MHFPDTTWTKSLIDKVRRHPKAQPKTGREFNWRWEWIAHLVNTKGWTAGAELGILKGNTFLYVLANCPKLQLIGVDLWSEQPDNTGPQNYVGREFDLYEKNVRDHAKKYGDRAIIIKDWTSAAANQVEDQSLDFVFVDADHSSQGVANDITTWMPKLKSTGWMLGHDINWPEVRTVVDELLPGYTVGPDNTYGRQK